jgi:predicted DNA-binding transcriptional regulator AlpA
MRIAKRSRKSERRRLIDDKFGEQLGITSPLLSIPEARAYLKMSQSWLYEHMGEFEIVKLGARVFITRASADEYLAARLQPQTPPPARPAPLVKRGRGRPRKAASAREIAVNT